MSMETVNNVQMVTITLDEYFELRTKANENLYLANELGRMETRFVEIERRLYELDMKIMENRGYERG